MQDPTSPARNWLQHIEILPTCSSGVNIHEPYLHHTHIRRIECKQIGYKLDSAHDGESEGMAVYPREITIGQQPQDSLRRLIY